MCYYYLQSIVQIGRRVFCSTAQTSAKRSAVQIHQRRTMSTNEIDGGILDTKADLNYIKRLKNLENIGTDRFRSQQLVPGSRLNKDVFGGLLFAHSIAAAEMTANSNFASHAAHSFFIRKATVDRPIEYSVVRLRDGRSYSTRLIQAHQDNNVVFCSQVSLCVPEPSAIEHQQAMPNVPPPEQLKPFSDLARAVLRDHEEGKTERSERIIKTLKNTLMHDQIALFEFRPVNPNQFLGLQPHSVLPVRYWLKCTVPLEELKNDSSTNRFLLAYITDATLVTTANRPHLSHGHQANMVLSLDHSVHFHESNFHADEWLLCENHSPKAKNGRAFSIGHIWTRDGRLVLSCNQESLSRSRSSEISKLDVANE